MSLKHVVLSSVLSGPMFSPDMGQAEADDAYCAACRDSSAVFAEPTLVRGSSKRGKSGGKERKLSEFTEADRFMRVKP